MGEAGEGQFVGAVPCPLWALWRFNPLALTTPLLLSPEMVPSTLSFLTRLPCPAELSWYAEGQGCGQGLPRGKAWQCPGQGQAGVEETEMVGEAVPRQFPTQHLL